MVAVILAVCTALATFVDGAIKVSNIRSFDAFVIISVIAIFSMVLSNLLPKSGAIFSVTAFAATVVAFAIATTFDTTFVLAVTTATATVSTAVAIAADGGEEKTYWIACIFFYVAEISSAIIIF